MSSSPAVSGQRFVLGFVAFVVVAVVGAITIWFLRKDPHGPVIAQVEHGGATYMLRQGYEERGYVHLMRVEQGEPVWSEALYGIEADPALTVTGNRVLVRAREARGHAELHAFDLDGEFVWRGGRNQHESPEGNPAFCDHPLWVRDGVVFYVHASGPREVIVLDLESGEERARVEIPAGEGPRSAAIIEGGLEIDGGDGVRSIVGIDGVLR